MANIFEQLMAQNRELSEAQAEPKQLHDVPYTNIKLESVAVFEEREFAPDFDAVDKFAALPEGEKKDAEVVEIVADFDLDKNEDGEVDEAALEAKTKELIGKPLYQCYNCGATFVCTDEAHIDENGCPDACIACGAEKDDIVEIARIADKKNADKEEEGDQEPVAPEDEEKKVEEKEEEKEEEVIEDSVQADESSTPLNEARLDTMSDDMKDVVTKATKIAADATLDKKSGVGSDPNAKYRDDLTKIGGKVEFDDDGAAKVVDKHETKDEEEVEESLTLNTENIEEGKCKAHGEDCDCPECKEKKAPKKEIDEECLESLMNEFLDENYKGAVSCKFTDASFTKDGQLALEYTLYKGNKAIEEGRLVSEGRVMRATNFLDESCTFAESAKRPSFTFEFVREGNKIIPTNLKYNFIKQINESVYRVTGEHSID